MRIAIISDGIPGHYNQSIGVANLLDEDISTQQTTFNMVYKFPLIRSITRLYLRHLFKNIKILKAQKVLDIYRRIIPPASCFRLIRIGVRIGVNPMAHS